MWSMEKKNEFIAFLHQHLQEQLEALQAQMNLLNNSIANETKSSAGDKYETSREMINQEINQIGNQIQNIRDQQGLMTKLNFDEKKQTCLGAIFATSKSIFCWSVSAGKISFQGDNIMCISSQSPFAQTCHDKMVGEKVGMANLETEVLWVV